jgi:hypothetical protein
MKQELAQDVALMRYSMISPLIVGLPEEFKTKEAFFRAASARGALHLKCYTKVVTGVANGI